MRTMENGLPFALPVLNLFQRLPVEDKAGAMTYVAVTSVSRSVVDQLFSVVPPQ